MDQDLALAQLRALAKVRGALRIVTAEIRPDLRVSAKDRAAGLKKGLDDDLLKRVDTFVLHDVVGLDGPDERGRLRARSAEGDWTLGYPADLLARLTEHQRG